MAKISFRTPKASSRLNKAGATRIPSLDKLPDKLASDVGLSSSFEGSSQGALPTSDSNNGGGGSPSSSPLSDDPPSVRSNASEARCAEAARKEEDIPKTNSCPRDVTRTHRQRDVHAKDTQRNATVGWIWFILSRDMWGLSRLVTPAVVAYVAVCMYRIQ